MAVACAAADLLRRRALDLDLVMLLEGEEEAGSGGFKETVNQKKVFSMVVFFIKRTDVDNTRGGYDWPR